MKKSVKILLAALLALTLIVGAICVSAFASGEEQTPNLQITACTLSFDDSVYIMYALPIDSAAGAEVKMLYFTEAQDTLDEYNYENAKYRESHIGIQNALGKDSYVYKNKHMNAKNMTDVVYARAYAKVGNTEYYSNLVKYSILEYAYNMLGYTANYTPPTKLKELLETMLAYGAASQKYFNYKVTDLATDSYFKVTVNGGHLSDMSNKGLFKSETELTLIGDVTGKTHTVWLDSAGKMLHIGETYDIKVGESNVTYKAEGHNLVFIEAKEPSCTENGNSAGVYCSTCNKIFLESETIVTEGHKFVDGECEKCGEPYNPSPWYPVDPSGTCGAEGADVNWFLDLSTGVLSITGSGAMENSYAPWSEYADKIVAVEVGGGVTDVGAYAFKDLTKVTSVSLPESLVTIRYGAFQGCVALETADLKSVTSISGAAFYGCTALNSVNIPEGVELISNNTFYQCTALEKIIIPNSVTSIANSAFNTCTNLREVVLSGNVTEVGNYAFHNCANIETLYFAGAAADFANITFGTYNTALTDADRYYYSETQPTDNDNKYWHYVDGEITVWPEYVAPTTYTVTFVDYDSAELAKIENVAYGASVTAPDAPTRDGYNFVGWDVDFSNVTSDLTVTAQYEEKSVEPTFVVDSVAASAGDTVEVRVRVENNPGIASIKLNVEYAEGVTLTNIVYNNSIGGMSQQPQKYDSPVIINWFNGTANSEGDFVLATLTFKVSDSAASGDYGISITYNPNDVYNIAENNIDFKIEDGKISV